MATNSPALGHGDTACLPCTTPSRRKASPPVREQATAGGTGASSGGGATGTGGARSALHSSLLGWTKKQSHILTGGGRTSDLYRPPRFPFSAEELPHHHKSRGSLHEAFDAWRLEVGSPSRLVVRSKASEGRGLYRTSRNGVSPTSHVAPAAGPVSAGH